MDFFSYIMYHNTHLWTQIKNYGRKYLYKKENNFCLLLGNYYKHIAVFISFYFRFRVSKFRNS